MIRVVITGPPREGRYPYRVETPGTRLAYAVSGWSGVPMWDACRMLKLWNVAEDDAAIGLYEQNKSGEFEGIMLGDTPIFFDTTRRLIRQTTVGEGAVNVAALTIPEAIPPSPHKSPEPQADTGRGLAKSNKPKKSRHLHRLAKSGGRLGRR